MGKNVQELRQEAHALLLEGKSLLDSKKTRSLTTQEERRVDWIVTRAEQLRADADEAERREGFTGVSRPQPSTAYHSRTADTQEAIFARVVRTADPMAMAELRASNDISGNIGTAADGGDLVPTAHFNDIIGRMRPQALHERLGVRMFQGIGTTMNVPVDGEADNGAFVATNEEGAFDRDFPAMSKVAMTYVKYTKKIELSVELLQDEDSNLLAHLAQYVADGMAATLNNLLVTEILSGGTAALTFDSATDIASGEVPELLYKLKSEYAEGSNVSWLMNRSTEGVLRGKVGDNFQFAPTPAGRPGARSEIFGYGVHTNSNVPAIGAGNKSLIIGNWSNLGLRLANGLTFLSDPYTLGHLGQTRLLYHFRAVFKTLQSEGIAYGTNPTA